MIDLNNLSNNSASHWQFHGSFDFDVPIGAFGFVYKISKINPLPNEKAFYIGRKYLTAAKTTSKRVLLKSGTKVTKKKKSRVESDWRVYMGSCQPLLREIERLGKEAFKFEILSFGFTRGQVNFMECWCQFRSDVLIDDSYFNDAIGSGQFRGVRFDSDFKKMLRDLN